MVQLLDANQVSLKHLVETLSQTGDAYRIGAQNDRAYYAKDEHATLSAPFTVTL